MFTQDQLDNLDYALRNLVFPTTSTRELLNVNRSSTFDKQNIIAISIGETPVASITLNNSDWVLFGKYLRCDSKTIIMATEMVDIIVEKLLGVSCGWKT